MYCVYGSEQGQNQNPADVSSDFSPSAEQAENAEQT